MTDRVISGKLIREDKKTNSKGVFFLLFHYLYNTIVKARRNKIVIVHGKIKRKKIIQAEKL